MRDRLVPRRTGPPARYFDSAPAAAHKTTKLGTEQYDRGLTDFLNVVDAERQEFDLEEQQVAARRKAAQELIALYKALGGGWPLNEVLPPLRHRAAGRHRRREKQVADITMILDSVKIGPARLNLLKCRNRAGPSWDSLKS